MKLKLEIDIDNDAFLDVGTLPSLLVQIGQAIEDSEEMRHPKTAVRDPNGNTVGWYVVE